VGHIFNDIRAHDAIPTSEDECGAIANLRGEEAGVACHDGSFQSANR
jgi:hypothetical protein